MKTKTIWKLDLFTRIVLTSIYLTSVPGSDVNVALQKPAIQSSTRPAPTVNLDAGNAVDGNLDADLNNGSCAQTSPKEDTIAQWWMVDLLKGYVIASVHILYRQDKWSDHIGNFVIETFCSNPTVFQNAVSTPCYHYTGSDFPGNETLTCSTPVLGRFVRIRKILPSPYKTLALCEVTVIGHVRKDNTPPNRTTALKMVSRTYLEATNVDRYENKTKLQCVMKCIKKERCQGVNHNQQKSTCVLVFDTWDTDKSTPNNSWILYTM